MRDEREREATGASLAVRISPPPRFVVRLKPNAKIRRGDVIEVELYVLAGH